MSLEQKYSEYLKLLENNRTIFDASDVADEILDMRTPKDFYEFAELQYYSAKICLSDHPDYYCVNTAYVTLYKVFFEIGFSNYNKSGTKLEYIKSDIFKKIIEEIENLYFSGNLDDYCYCEIYNSFCKIVEIKYPNSFNISQKGTLVIWEHVNPCETEMMGFFINNTKNTPRFVDEVIEINYVTNLIDILLKYKDEDYTTINNEKRTTFYKKNLIYYYSEWKNNNGVLLKHITQPDEYFDKTGRNGIYALEDLKNNFCIVAGVNAGHPFIHSSIFLYLNSDGSGPDVSHDLFCNPQEMLDSLIKKIQDFSKNKYH